MIDLVNPAATLIASFAGAWAAFKLQASDKARDVRLAHIAALNSTLMTMMRQTNTLKLYQADHINPHREHPGRHITIRPTLPYDLDALRFDFSSLNFLDTSREQQLLFELSVEERRFIETLRAINARSDLMLTELDPKLSAAGFLDGGSYEGGEVKAALGQPLYNKLERLTNDVIYHVDRTDASLQEMKNKLLASARKRYPKTTFVDFEFLEPKAAP
jgi:hypothetical protein